MIYHTLADSKVWRKSEKIRGFVKDETIRKYMKKNLRLNQNKTRINPQTVIIAFLLFCGSILIYHLYTLWVDNNNKKEEIKKDKSGQISDYFLSPEGIKENTDVQPMASTILLSDHNNPSQGTKRKAGDYKIVD